VTARCAAEQNRDLFAVPGNVTNKGSWTPNTLIKQGAKLVATWEDVWEDLPSQVRLELEAEAPVESKSETDRILLPDPVLRPEEAMVLEVLHSDESLQIDEILECWRRNLRLQRYLRRFLSWRWRAGAVHCRGRITCGRCERDRDRE
jgi:DNA processing protein